jgi:hypothetical protein
VPIIGLDPTSGPVAPSGDRRLSRRPATLEGAMVGLVCNGLGRGEPLFDRLGEYLVAEAGARGVVKVVKRSVSVPPDPEDWARLTEEATVALTGFGG